MGNHDNCACKVKDWSRWRGFIRSTRQSFLGVRLFSKTGEQRSLSGLPWTNFIQDIFCLKCGQ